MIKDTIPPESLMIGQPVAVNILKCAEHGIEKGFTQEAKGMIVTKDMEITLSQF